MELTTIVQQKIYEIRGQRVMLDFDLAEMYGMETKRLKASVRRNMKRFPSDFMFELTQEEYISLRTKISSLKNGGRGQHPKYMPFAFTEQGVAMLSSVLNSDIAIEVNIAIMRAFVAVRQLIATPPTDCISNIEQEVKELKIYIEEVFTDQNDINEDTRMQLELINQTLAEMQMQKKQTEKPRNKIGFK
ncbi:ORF6N domain-containing protein [Bacteroides helcogenes]|uniref:KilA-N, DNA-binding domain protein n=1 Tax=Bacteroides helcogenes (strain ATCC 35417 / DSM 20613 / JCM 6297 / CCUG 15421 / P 36-108) TaxID=693979 RepID=E6SMY1_BACT6|nr:ORF6N domain-containing protein [Bacteroides helcogenes]ADV42697.1 KilA-N, DNA-binding domain protein [Bacteroides helcogenes P 36-108]MDY5239527.1 ORF6N domain-containing protein [Bacteroides helcogenes]